MPYIEYKPYIMFAGITGIISDLNLWIKNLKLTLL